MTPRQRSCTCTEAADLLDLYAADACAADQAESLSAHLAHCPTCTASLEEARELQASLDWTARAPAARARLRAAVDAEAAAVPQRSHGGPPGLWIRRLGSLAALLVVVLGLTLFFGDDRAPGPTAFPMTVLPGDSRMLEMKNVPAMGVQEPLEKRKGEPIPVDVPFEVRNDAARAVRLHLRDRETRLQIDLQGPGELRRQPTLAPPEIPLQPGATARLILQGLTATKPGDYQLRGHLRVAADFAATATEAERRGTVWLTFPSMPLRVPAQ